MRPIWARRRDAAAFHLGTPEIIVATVFTRFGKLHRRPFGRTFESISQGKIGVDERVSRECIAAFSNHTRASAERVSTRRSARRILRLWR
jgi:hypothetical protein